MGYALMGAFSLFIQLAPFAWAEERNNMMNLTDREQQAIFRARQNGGQIGNGGPSTHGKGCLHAVVGTLQRGQQRKLQAQTQEGNMLMGLASDYYNHEMDCKNQLAQIKMEHSQAVAEQESKQATLASKIELQQIEYEEALLAVKQECESTSGEAFTRWKADQSTKVVRGLDQLVGRQKNINRFQKLFYDDCLASPTNIQRVELLGRKLAANVAALKAEVDASAKMLANHSKNMSFRQGVVAENCVEGKKMLDYKKAIAQSNANAVNRIMQSNNFLDYLSNANQCISGPGQTNSQQNRGTSRNVAQ